MLVGNKREKLGRSEFEMFDEGDAHEREKFWPISKVSDVIVTSIVEHALAGLRYDIDAAKLLDYKLLKDFKILSIIGGGTNQKILPFLLTFICLLVLMWSLNSRPGLL